MHQSIGLKHASLLLAMLLCLMPFALHRSAQPTFAITEAVGWGSITIPYNNAGLLSLYPDIKYDRNGKLHIGWVEYGATDADGARLLYMNNLNGSWSTPYEVSTTVGRGTDPLHVMTLEQNRVHFLYITSGNLVAHRYLTINGSTVTKSPVTTLSTTKSSTPELLTDSSGKVHAFWGDRRVNANNAQVIHRIWANGAWEANGGRVIRSDGNNQRYISATQTSDGVIHVAFGAYVVFRYATFNGSTWTAGSDLFSGSVKQIVLTSKGNTVAALYSVDSSGRKMYYQIGYGTNWSNRVLLSSGSSFDDYPELLYNSNSNRLYAVWLSGVTDKNLTLAQREIIIGGAISELSSATNTKAERKWLRGDSLGSNIHMVWADKSTGVWGIRALAGDLGGPPLITPTPTLPPVGFTLARSSASPSNNPNVGLTITNLSGNPDQMRVSTSAFIEQAPSPAWEGLNTSKIVATGAGVSSCNTTIYVQLRNSGNATVSNIQTVSAVIDAAIQATPNIYTMETAPNARLADLNQAQTQPFAPNRVSEKYTRNMTFSYSIAQEPSGCSGITRHKAGPHLAPTTSYPHTAFAAFDSFAMGNDSSGSGFEEQTVSATIILTDTLGNQSTTSKQFGYDDDAPVLSNGGTITLPTTSTLVSVIPVDFTAVVTDDGYLNTAPADKRYWGVWVVASTSASLPNPQDFLQYGDVIGLADGATHVNFVRLVNALTGTQAGPRYIHMRFLDGAGNYTETGLTSQMISLQPSYTGLLHFLPIATNN